MQPNHYAAEVVYETIAPKVQRIRVLIYSEITIDDNHLQDAERLLRENLEDKARTLTIDKRDSPCYQ